MIVELENTFIHDRIIVYRIPDICQVDFHFYNNLIFCIRKVQRQSIRLFWESADIGATEL